MNFAEEIKRTPRRGSSNQEQQASKSRLAQSPLRVPLEKALSKLATNINQNNKRYYNQDQILLTPQMWRQQCGRSTKRFSPEESEQGYDDDRGLIQNMHTEAVEFLKKYFSGYSLKNIPTTLFVEYLMKEFSNLWTESQAKTILSEFINKLSRRLGRECLSIKKLYILTKENGLIGLILNIFRELKEEQEIQVQQSQEYEGNQELQNIKCIIQEYVEGMYSKMENQAYTKFNGELRRLVLRHKQAECILKQINQKITENYDRILLDKKRSEVDKNHEIKAEKASQRIKQLEIELDKERLANKNLVNENMKLAQQNIKLQQKLEKFQTYLLTSKIDNPPRQKDQKPQTAYIAQPQRYRNMQVSTPSTRALPVIVNYQNPVNQPPIQTDPHFMTHRYISINTDLNKGANYMTCNSNPNRNQEPVRKGISTTINDKQNMQIRPTTPSKIQINKPLSSPNNLIKVRRV